MEVQREALAVGEHPRAQFEQRVLAHAPGQREEPGPQQRRGHAREGVADDRRDQGRGTAVERAGHADVDGGRDEQRPGEHGDALGDQQHRGQRQAAPVRAGEVADQRAGAALQRHAGRRQGVGLLVLGGQAAPDLDRPAAGERFGVGRGVLRGRHACTCERSSGLASSAR